MAIFGMVTVSRDGSINCRSFGKKKSEKIVNVMQGTSENCALPDGVLSDYGSISLSATLMEVS